MLCLLALYISALLCTLKFKVFALRGIGTRGFQKQAKGDWHIWRPWYSQLKRWSLCRGRTFNPRTHQHIWKCMFSINSSISGWLCLHVYIISLRDYPYCWSDDEISSTSIIGHQLEAKAGQHGHWPGVAAKGSVILLHSHAWWSGLLESHFLIQDITAPLVKSRQPSTNYSVICVIYP